MKVFGLATSITLRIPHCVCNPKSANLLSVTGRYKYTSRKPPHPLAGHKVLQHRARLFDAIGIGPHACHWCGVQVSWEIKYPAAGALVVDHLDCNKANNQVSNLVVSCQPCNASRIAKQMHADGRL